MTDIMILALIPLFAVLNRLRGKFGAGGIVVGVAVVAVVFVITLQPELAAACGVLYIAGESVGWGRWIKIIGRSHDGVTQFQYMDHHREKNRGKFIHNIANKIAKESKDYVSYGWAALMIRAAIWFPPILILLAAWGVADPVAAIAGSVVCIVTFPIAYSVARQIEKKNYWGRGEIIYGAVQGAALALAFIA